LILYRQDRSCGGSPRFECDGWQDYVPIRLPEARVVRNHMPPGIAAVLINPAHSDHDLILPVNADELKLVEAIDGERTIEAIIQRVSTFAEGGLGRLSHSAKCLFERLWWYDQVVFDIHS
jgi:hypothetical protein